MESPLTTPVSQSPSLDSTPNSHERKLRDDQELFASVLSRARRDGPPQPDEVRKAAEDFVATALVQPVLKLLRESNQAAEPFKPNAAERSFRTMYDSALAARITRSGHWPLVERVIKQFMARATHGEALPAGSASPEVNAGATR